MKIFPQEDLTDFETQLICLSLLLQLWLVLDTFPWENFFFHVLAGSSSLKLSLKFKTIVLVNHRITKGLKLERSSGGHLV